MNIKRFLPTCLYLYRVVQSYGNSFGGDVVLDSLTWHVGMKKAFIPNQFYEFLFAEWCYTLDMHFLQSL